jgi:hypothetical protein
MIPHHVSGTLDSLVNAYIIFRKGTGGDLV